MNNSLKNIAANYILDNKINYNILNNDLKFYLKKLDDIKKSKIPDYFFEYINRISTEKDLYKFLDIIKLIDSFFKNVLKSEYDESDLLKDYLCFYVYFTFKEKFLYNPRLSSILILSVIPPFYNHFKSEINIYKNKYQVIINKNVKFGIKNFYKYHRALYLISFIYLVEDDFINAEKYIKQLLDIDENSAYILLFNLEMTKLQYYNDKFVDFMAKFFDKYPKDFITSFYFLNRHKPFVVDHIIKRISSEKILEYMDTKLKKECLGMIDYLVLAFIYNILKVQDKSFYYLEYINKYIEKTNNYFFINEAYSINQSSKFEYKSEFFNNIYLSLILNLRKKFKPKDSD